MNSSDEEYRISRRGTIGAVGSLATVGLAGCGSTDSESEYEEDNDSSETNGSDEDNEPELESVNLALEGELPDTVDFTEEDLLETGYTPVLKLEYSDGEEEEVELEDGEYTVKDGYVQRTNGEDFYGTTVGDPELKNSIEEEFDEEMLRKAGFYQEIDNIDELTPEQLYAGLNQVGFTLEVDQETVQEYTEQGTELEDNHTKEIEQTVETVKSDEETLQDNLPNEDAVVELWRELRSNNAEVSLGGEASGDGASEAGFEDLYDLEEEVMSNVDSSEDNQEMLRQISEGWDDNAGRATGVPPAAEAKRLSDIIVRNTEMVPFVTSNNTLSTVAAYDSEEGDIIHVLTQGEGQAVYDIEDMFYFDDASVRNASPILNTDKNKDSAQSTMNVMHKFLENDLQGVNGGVDRDTAVAFMDEIRANDAHGENVDTISEGIETNLRAAVANAMRTDPNLLFEFNQAEEGEYVIEMKDAEDNINS